MRRALHRLALALTALLALSGVWLTWTAHQASTRLRDDPRNVRSATGAFLPGAGRIVSADGVVLAEDRAGVRTYPHGVEYAHLIGYATADQRRGIEDSRYAALRVRRTESITDWLHRLAGADRAPHDVVLTVLDPLQQAARQAIAGSTGAIVVLDVDTGAVLAYVSSPSYDPNRVVAGTLDPDSAPDAVIDRVADRVLPPGSTFKIVVAAAALEAGASPGTRFPDAAEYEAPGSGAPIRNASDGLCGDGTTLSLTEALSVSCNTIFARLAVELGADAISSAAARAGFDAAMPWETGLARSTVTGAALLAGDPGALAQTAIGERDVRATPLLMAIITAAVGNDGEAMRPYVVDSIRTAGGDLVRRTESSPLGRMFSKGTARDLYEMMQAVVEEGTGGAARVDGITVAGKTGTAEGSGGPHAWFVALAGRDRPEIAIAVLVEGGGSGGRVAAPLARAVIEEWVRGVVSRES